ncbi:MAG: hypothetical protein EOO04_00165 [Chitinophagaceae bacterium]|nr:MAG: hypothetical protein EOO04_00165 [Chitinophagaceae bacterium]
MDLKNSLAELNHFIDLDEARKLIGTFQEMKYQLVNTRYDRMQKEYGVLPTSEAFNQKSILSLLAQDDCVGIRIHYGVKLTEESGEQVPLLVAVLVGVRSDGSNIWTNNLVAPEQTERTLMMHSPGRDAVILEDSQRCPPYGDSDPIP